VLFQVRDQTGVAGVSLHRAMELLGATKYEGLRGPERRFILPDGVENTRKVSDLEGQLFCASSPAYYLAEADLWKAHLELVHIND